MKQIAFATLLLVAVLGQPAVREVRANDTCAVGCTADVWTCLQTGIAAKLACRADCKTEGRHLGACMRDCRVAFRAQRASCRSGGHACASRCDEPGEPGESPDPACPGRCGAALGQCLHDASGGMPACLDGCDKGRDRHACVQDCLTTAMDGASGCRTQHDDCLAACGGVSTTTTTLPPPPPCGEAQAPACGGVCPEAALTCAEIEPGICGCVGGSPSAAFVQR